MSDFKISDGKSERTLKAGIWLPFVDGGGLVMMPGETLVLELRAKGDKLEPVVLSSGRADRLVKDERDAASERDILAISGKNALHRGETADNAAVRAGADTVRVTLEQAAGRRDMILRIDNGYDRPLDYSATLQRIDADDTETTTVCPILAKAMNLEGWPFPIVMVHLSDFRFVDDHKETKLEDCD